MKRGEQSRIADQIGISRTYMGLILKRVNRPSPELAAKLEKVTGIDRLAWLYPDEHPNPLLRPISEVSNGN